MKPIIFNLSNLTNNKVHETHGKGIADEKILDHQKFLYGNLKFYLKKNKNVNRCKFNRSPRKAFISDSD